MITVLGFHQGCPEAFVDVEWMVLVSWLSHEMIVFGKKDVQVTTEMSNI